MDLTEYSFDEKHISQERLHGVTREEAEGFMKNADILLTRWNGRFKNYYSSNGAVYIDTKEKNIRTAFKSKEYDNATLQLMEVIKRYGKD